MSTIRRKDEHLAICLAGDVDTPRANGLADYELEYDALPELDLAQVSLAVTVLGKRLSAPLIIGAMTGGSQRAAVINQRLARVAERLGLGMALGSQRAMLEDPAVAASYSLREDAPSLPLVIGNLGATQLGSTADVARIEQALDTVGADALAFHLNPLQEAIQPEGSTCFAGLHQRLGAVCAALSRPVVVKEVGSGISAITAAKLATLPIAGVDVAGLGGTSWLRVEARRCEPGSRAARLGEHLADLGVPTARSIRACRRVMGERLVIASGGIRTGRDIAVALALGADAVAIARPLLVAADQGEDVLEEHLGGLIDELRLLCFATGAPDVGALRRVRLLDRHGATVGDW